MFGNHTKDELSAYAHGALSVADTERVARHLATCPACRREFEEIKFGIRLVESLPTANAPASLWESIEAGLIKNSAQAKQAAGHSQPTPTASRLRGLWFPSSVGRQRAAFAGLLLLAALCGMAGWVYYRSTRPAWEVARLAGSPVIDSRRISGRGKLGVGEWLETDAGSRAELKVANIGEVEIEPGTRVRLLETRLTEHRLELERGRISARIWAPPRLFFVNTPSAVAEDLGCAYTLEVDDRGRSLLHVTSGWVALQLKDRESVVPAGAACATTPETGPGTPFFEDATETFLDALSRFDFEDGGADALSTVLDHARPRDTLTLWHLLPRVEGEERRRVYERLAAFAPPPEGVTRDGVLRLDAPMLESWKDQLETGWLDESLPAVRKALRKMLK